MDIFVILSTGNICFANVFLLSRKIKIAIERVEKQRERQGPRRSSYAELTDL